MTGSTNQFIHFEPTNTLSKIHPKNYNNSPPISKSWIRAWDTTLYNESSKASFQEFSAIILLLSDIVEMEDDCIEIPLIIKKVAA